MTATKKTARAPAERTGDEIDDALAAAARGFGPTSDDAPLDEDGRRLETDAIGHAAGFVVDDGEPLGGPDAVARRDAHRWELDPASAEDNDGDREPAPAPSAKPRMR